MPTHVPANDLSARGGVDRTGQAEPGLRVIGAALYTAGEPFSAVNTPLGFWFSMVSRTLAKKAQAPTR